MILTIIASISLAAWTYLLFGRGGYWRAQERLEPAPEPASWPEVIAVIPARNEADSIGQVIASHMACSYPGAFSVILVDDGSSDDTADVAWAAVNGGRQFKVIEAPTLEAGWTGKLWALHNGVAHAKTVAPDAQYFLFTDADIVHAPQTLERLVAKAEADNLVLTSLMARLDARGFWGELLIPAFVYFFQKLYPFSKSNNPASDVAAAAGGCMLIRRNALAAAGGVAAIRDRLIDDCALAHLLKSASIGADKIWIGLATNEVVSIRDNRSFGSIATMVARTAFAQLRHSWFLLAGTILGMGIIYLAPPTIALAYPLHANAPAGVLALGAWLSMAASFLPTARLYNLAPWKTILLPVSAFFYSCMTVASAIRHARGGGGQWKGRTYPQ